MALTRISAFAAREQVVEQRRVDGISRVRFDRGWTSIKTSHGTRLLKKLDV
jgi:hypothetical protein